MNLVEIAVVLIGLVAGYWAVSKLFFSDNNRPSATAAPTSPAAAPPDPTPRWYDILGVASTAGEAEIRNAYQRLVSQYHPDKVEALGPELKDLAIQKTQQITAAYREALQVCSARP